MQGCWRLDKRVYTIGGGGGQPWRVSKEDMAELCMECPGVSQKVGRRMGYDKPNSVWDTALKPKTKKRKKFAKNVH